MAAITQYMEPEEREEWETALADALDGSNGQADQAAIECLVAMIEQADRAGRVWPDILRDQWAREGARLTLKAFAKARAMVLVSHDGHLISKTSRRGVRVTKADGRREWQNVLWQEMTWDQFDQWRILNRDQVKSLQVNEAAAASFAALRDQAPESTGPQDACAQIGTTIEEVLAS